MVFQWWGFVIISNQRFSNEPSQTHIYRKISIMKRCLKEYVQKDFTTIALSLIFHFMQIRPVSISCNNALQHKQKSSNIHAGWNKQLFISLIMLAFIQNRPCFGDLCFQYFSCLFGVPKKIAQLFFFFNETCCKSSHLKGSQTNSTKTRRVVREEVQTQCRPSLLSAAVLV